MSRCEDATFPGAYLRDRIAPYVDRRPPTQGTETLVDGYKAAMKGRGWQTIPQISGALCVSTDAVRAYLNGKLKKLKLVESKAGDAPHRGGPTPGLWRWIGDT